MKNLKLISLVLSVFMILSLCACTPGASVQTGAAAQAPASTLASFSDAQIVSYDPYYDEESDCFLYYVTSFGEPQTESGKVSQDNGSGVTLVSMVHDASEMSNGTDLLEARINRSKNVLAEFGEDIFAFYETSDNGVNVCYFEILAEDDKSVSFELSFPTDERDTHFYHVSMLLQIYLDVYAPAAE